jgi:ferric-dicitrate binding protein FerR (iron transport regulator)
MIILRRAPKRSHGVIAVQRRRSGVVLLRKICQITRVAVEFNRYAATPIEIDTPALRALTVSGVFASDDTESFIAFLRSLDGVRVEVTPTRIRVSRK